MSSIARQLKNDEQIYAFLSAIGFEKYFQDASNFSRVFQHRNDIKYVLGESITLIKQVNSDLEEVTENNTLVSDKYRTYPYQNEADRKNLRNKIIEELISLPCPSNDDDICLGYGGMLPQSKVIYAERKCSIIIGLPASGKSGIATKISNFYNAILIDSDFAKRKFPEYRKTNGASLVHEESKNIYNAILESSIEVGANIVLPIIGADYNKVVEIIRNLRRHKYSISVVLVELDCVKATQRAFNRFMQTNRYIPLAMILDEYSNNPSLVFYKLLYYYSQLSMALIDTDVPFGEKPKIKLTQNFKEIHKILK